MAESACLATAFHGELGAMIQGSKPWDEKRLAYMVNRCPNDSKLASALGLQLYWSGKIKEAVTCLQLAVEALEQWIQVHPNDTTAAIELELSRIDLTEASLALSS